METKNWYRSKTIWGAILMIISLILSQFTGVEMTGEEQEAASNTLIVVGEGAAGLIGFILVIIGRIKANKKISGGGSTAAKILVFMILIPTLFMGGLTGCATLGGGGPTKTFDQLTPDEQARVLISAIQYGSDPLFDIGKTIMIAKPEYLPAWKIAVVPTFDQLNKILLDLETKGSQGQQISAPLILQSVQGRIAEIISTITQYGAIGKSAGSKPTPNDYGLIAILGLSTATVIWNDVVTAMSGQIPSWEIIMARNQALQFKIDGEKKA